MAADPKSGIDPRGPRFGAAITAILLLLTVFLSLLEPQGTREATPATLLLLALVLLFAWGAVAGIRRHPWGVLYRLLLRPRLAPPTELEDPAPPTFAQGVGFAVTAAGVILQLLGVPYAIPVAAAAAFLAAFLNAAFGYCLGCQLYLGLARLGLIRRSARDAAAG